jgi:PiT family inorganic phosphate transporter
LTLLLLVVLGLAVLFDYINGFHDTANAIATSVSTRALRPEHAILMSATANFLGALTGTAVAQTISKGLADTPPGNAGQIIVAAALVGAIVWNLITWRLGIPSSSSHALIGGLLGAVIVSVGAQAIKADGVVNKVLVPLVLSPVLGILIGFGAMVVLLNVFRRANPRRINERFRRLQVLSAAAMAFSHGSNDAQKTMGIITLALIAGGLLPANSPIPLWVIVVAATAISMGTAVGGWRIIKTMGQRVVKLDPVHGVDHLCRLAFRNARLDDPRDLERDHGCRRERPALGGPLGGGREHRDRLDPDDPGVGDRRRACLRGAVADPLTGGRGRRGGRDLERTAQTRTVSGRRRKT